jgi:hypothetical protein
LAARARACVCVRVCACVCVCVCVLCCFVHRQRFGDSEEKLRVMCESLKQRYGVAPALLPEDEAGQ